MDYQFSCLSNKGNTRCSVTPIIIPNKAISNAKDNIHELESPRLQHSLTDVKIWHNSKEGSTIINQMQRRLILIWNACTRYKDLQTLQPKQKKYLILCEHIQHCKDTNCKRMLCKSSRRIINHYKHCTLLNHASTCKLCSRVMRYIAQNSCNDNHLTSKQHGKTHVEKMEWLGSTVICESDKNKTSSSYKPKRISEVTSTVQRTTTRVKKNSLPQKQSYTNFRWNKNPNGTIGIDSVIQAMKTKDTKTAFTQKQRRATVRWDKSVTGGIRADSVVHAVKAKGVQKATLLLQQIQTYARTHTCKIGEERDEWNLNHIITSKIQHEKTALSGIGSTFKDRLIPEEEKEDRVSASIALLILKKRTWENIGNGSTSSTPMKVAKIV